ncbi:hypothetical protein SDRG_03740 [Saprolegnia diclina VS20]|uniref:Superoxide dismutase copper/zinc binding domain-containing protein n=1 Tax=Saprolegnia diclina (strain VS20) TaxID=1156394 RepID=T0QVS1_SAPDV|nr:hypothetical protein SDRG_03740 [Saprolegnia diclina VS20]EQC38781.1 hypothetical protein SDRG_03740 [Saprolegnia diclina VS20]|eukprot:XP_008607605.1 hypothetical protein SDRG_03740 [Saprolegnia diclina VS20]
MMDTILAPTTLPMTLPPSSMKASVYDFDPATAAGVHGQVIVHYKKHGARIHAHLDLRKANWTALSAIDANCTGPVDTFGWHLHTKWTNGNVTSAFGAGCSLAAAGNHYDPSLACGPNSEHQRDTCLSKAPGGAYNCTAATYAANATACEAGDLSGKLGTMVARHGHIRKTWRDWHYPSPHEATPQWNLMLHAVCGSSTPRFVCAVADNSKAAWHRKHKDELSKVNVDIDIDNDDIDVDIDIDIDDDERHHRLHD